MLGIAVLTGIVSIIASYYSAIWLVVLVHFLRKRLVDKTQRLSMADMDEFGTPTFLARTTSDIVRKYPTNHDDGLSNEFIPRTVDFVSLRCADWINFLALLSEFRLFWIVLFSLVSVSCQLRRPFL